MQANSGNGDLVINDDLVVCSSVVVDVEDGGEVVINDDLLVCSSAVVDVDVAVIEGVQPGVGWVVYAQSVTLLVPELVGE